MQTVPSKQKAGTGPEIPISFPSGIAHQVHLHRLLPACWFSCVALLQRPLSTIRREMCAWKSSSMATCSRCSLPSVFYLCVCGPNSTGRANGSETSVSLNEKCSETNLLLIFRLSWDKYIVAITLFPEAPCRGVCKVCNWESLWGKIERAEDWTKESQSSCPTYIPLWTMFFVQQCKMHCAVFPSCLLSQDFILYDMGF